jgi:hypothetical protein
VVLQLEGVGVEPATGPLHRRAKLLEPFLEPTAPTLENPQASSGVGSRKEGEVHTELLVVPGRWTRLAE